MHLKGKNILITGGSLGIGKETAMALLKKGANILVTGRSKKRLISAFKNTSVKTIDFDIGDLDSIEVHAKKCLSILENKVDV